MSAAAIRPVSWGASLPANAFRSELARLEQVLPDRTVFLFAVHPKAEIFWI
jgi:hypothetical protein